MPARQVPAAARRADAERNRDKILAAARAAFADPDADASMAEVSRRAGVGMATLYRNFPGRQELLEALYADEVSAVCEAALLLPAASLPERLWRPGCTGSLPLPPVSGTSPPSCSSKRTAATRCSRTAAAASSRPAGRFWPPRRTPARSGTSSPWSRSSI